MYDYSFYETSVVEGIFLTQSFRTLVYFLTETLSNGNLLA